MSEYYLRCISKCDGNDNGSIQIKNLRKEYDYFILNSDFREQDIYKKHHEYCFTRGEPMSGQEIKDIRREIKTTTGIQISYENPK